MPVVDGKPCRRVVFNRVSVVVDSPGIMPILMHKTLLHWQMLLEPFTTMPFPDQGREVAHFLEGLGNRAFFSIQSMNTPGGLTTLIDRQCQP